MKDSVEFNIKFIELIRERPCLYDYTRVDYSNKAVQDAAWAQVANLVSESVPDCKERWKNLRGCYTRHLKKCHQVSGPSGKRVKPYYLSGHLSFLGNFTKTREPKEKLKVEDTQSEDDDMDEHGPEPRSSIDRKEFIIETSEPYQIQVSKTPKHVYMNDINGTDVEYFPSKQENLMIEKQDPDFAFLYSVLPDMHEMTREQKRKFKMGVIKLAGDILQEKS